jgi:hypothetical protein
MSHFATLLSQIRRIVTNPAFKDKKLLRKPMEDFSEIARETENSQTVFVTKILSVLQGLLVAARTSAQGIENRNISPTPAAEVIDYYEEMPANENGRELMLTLMQSLEQNQTPQESTPVIPSRYLSIKSDPPAAVNIKSWDNQVLRKAASALDIGKTLPSSYHLSSIERSPIAGALIHFTLNRDSKRTIAAQMTSGQLKRIAEDTEHLFPGQFKGVSKLLDDEGVDIATLFRSIQQYFGFWSTTSEMDSIPSLVEVIAPSARNPHKPLPPKPSALTRCSTGTNGKSNFYRLTRL